MFQYFLFGLSDEYCFVFVIVLVVFVELVVCLVELLVEVIVQGDFLVFIGLCLIGEGVLDVYLYLVWSCKGVVLYMIDG